MSYTLITHFDSASYEKLYAALEPMSKHKVCRVPYGRVENKKRYSSDTLPLHFTVSSSKEGLYDVLKRLRGFEFEAFEIIINGLATMGGRNNSKILYFSIKPSKEFDHLQEEIYKRLGNEKYLPGKSKIHLTLCISIDHDKISIIKNQIENNFKPFNVRVTSLGLYEIWPGKLKSIFQSIET